MTLAYGAAPTIGQPLPLFVATPGGVMQYLATPIGILNAFPEIMQQGIAPPDFASLNVYPRNGTDSSNYLSDPCPTCGNIHHLYSLAPFTCSASGQPGTKYIPALAGSDLASGDMAWIEYGKNLFVAVGCDMAVSSWDGRKWARNAIPSGQWQTVCFNGSNLFIAGGYDQWYGGIIASSPDGINWAQGVLPAGLGLIMFLLWDGAQFIGLGTNTAIYSAAGTTWTKVAIASGAWGPVQYNGSNLYVALDYAGQVSTSADGRTWVLKAPLPAGSLPQDMAWGSSKFVAIGYNSLCLTSTDGITWAARTIPAGNYTCVRWDGAQFVAVGNGVCATSTDGIVWTARATMPSTGYFTDVNFRTTPANAAMYAAVGLAMAIASGTNGQIWAARSAVGGWEVLKANKIIES